MLTASERKELIDKIVTLPEILQAAIQGLNDAQLDTPYRTGGWTVRQVVHHLADAHMNAFIRMKLVLTEDKPILKAWPQEVWAELKDTVVAPIESSLSILKGVHTRWGLLFYDIVDDAIWQRVGIHTENGEMKLEDLLKSYARHGETHVAQITQLRREKGW